MQAYIRYIAAIYATRFDDYAGEQFQVLGQQQIKHGTLIKTHIVKSNGEPVSINYIVHDNDTAWQIRDIYLSGSISELATRRSEFAAILRTGGIDGLIPAEQEGRRPSGVNSPPTFRLSPLASGATIVTVHSGQADQKVVEFYGASVLPSFKNRWPPATDPPLRPLGAERATMCQEVPRRDSIVARSFSSCSWSSGVIVSKSDASNTWRISISASLPGRGSGQRLTHSIASSFELTWNIQNPAISSSARGTDRR